VLEEYSYVPTNESRGSSVLRSAIRLSIYVRVTKTDEIVEIVDELVPRNTAKAAYNVRRKNDKRRRSKSSFETDDDDSNCKIILKNATKSSKRTRWPTI